MADFEGLIRQALARQDSSDPEIREKIYRASRNALARMIASAGAQPPSVIQQQRDALENCIARIESGYGEVSQVRQVSQDPQNPPNPENTPVNRPEPPSTAPVAPPPISPQPAQTAESEESLVFEEEDRVAYRAGGEGRRTIAVVAIILLLGVIAWLLYTLVTTLVGESGPASSASSPPAESNGEISVANETSQYVTVLSPQDTETLRTAGRGTAEIINQANLELIRLVSLRGSGRRDEPADPILMRLRPGVIERIAGRRVTVEILAKSGSSGPATFSIQCIVDEIEICGRKRFRVGLQPEAIVFTMNVPEDVSGSSSAHFGINTDITGSAALTGQGDAVDILYARIRVSNS